MNEMDTRFANQYNIQWFPGHMTKTLRMMEQEIQHVDASLVLLDARIPLSSLNPEIERITDRKPKLYALNKADLADPAVTEEWIRYFHAADAGCVAISAKQKGGANAVKVAIEKELSGLLERRQNRGMGGAKTQVMLCGIPNVGKSTFINTFAGSARAKAADRPGVTKGKQWVSTEKFDLLDMPGVLWKKFDSKTIASNLAFIGSIKDDILDVEELAMNLLDEVRRNYPDLVAQRYKLDAETLALPPYELMEAIGRKRGLLARRQNRGMAGDKTQVMLCGIPNVGKSTFINTFAGSARAKAADRPGVTKGKQWVSTEKFDLLDMPGVLWKKFDSKTIASNLAFIGSIKDDILDVEELAMNLLDEVRRNYPDLVAQRYKLDAETLALPPYELMEAIGRKRGLLVRGGEVNTERCAVMLVDEFRACKWGRISLERPPQRDDMADFAEEDED